MACEKNNTRLRITGIVLLGAAAFGFGCASSEPAPISAPVTQVSEPSSLVFSSPPVRNWHASNTGQPGVGLIAADRYEYSRNDASLTPTSRGPLIATRQWPEPPRPAERPVRFWRWQQR